jgi:hypothetical protein
MTSLAFHLYVMAVGFVAAGISASFAQLVSGEPLRFGVEAKSIPSSIGGVLLRAFAGPVILMGNAVSNAKAKARSPMWLGLSTLIAGVWSLFLGSVLLDLLLKL